MHQFRVGEGYKPGVVGRLTEIHANFYSDLVGFGSVFETQIASDLAQFVPRLAREVNSLWFAELDEEIVGGIAIDGEDLGHAKAHLRWFIVDDGLRGSGAGKALIRSAIDFCDTHGFLETHLWTFKGLDAARKLYEENGFVLAEEYVGDQWGVEVVEQRFVRSRAYEVELGL